MASPKHKSLSSKQNVLKGLVVGRQGKLAHVWMQDQQQLYRCHTRRQQLQVVCGDWVMLSLGGDGEGVVEQCLERKNVFSRRDLVRTKTIAANVDQVLGVLAWDPFPSESLLMRWMIAAYTQEVDFIMVVNKQDLASYLPEHPLHEWITRYRALGVPVVQVSATTGGVTALYPFMEGKISLLIGQSGAGKSSLINACIPGLQLETQLLSEAIGGGKHTTTTTQLYWLNETRDSALVDSPGMQTFGVLGLDRESIIRACPDMRPYLGQCKFRNCKHQQEPDCAFHAALEAGRIHPERWEVVLELFEEVEQQNPFA